MSSDEAVERSQRWFASAWPGRWRWLDVGAEPAEYTPAGDLELRAKIDEQLAALPLPEGVAPESVVPQYFCDDCRALIIGEPSGPHPRPSWIGDWVGDRWSWRPIPHVERTSGTWDPSPLLGGDHRHDDLTGPTDGRVRYYLMDGTGPYKTERLGTWADVVAAMPYVVTFTHPFPPRPVVNELLSTGLNDAGMSGGVEYPPTSPSVDEYQEMRSAARWARTPYVDSAVPDEIQTRAQFTEWWTAVLDRHRLAFIRLRREYHELLPTGDLPEEERLRRSARQVALSRRLYEDLERIERETPIMIEIRVPFEYPSKSYGRLSYSLLPPDGPAGDSWRSIDRALRAVLEAGADGYVHSEWKGGILCAGLAVTETGPSTERDTTAAIAELVAEPVDGMTVVRNGSLIWPADV